ncbi:hypothetical protein ACI3KS_05035 [Microbacterium sp. ZW T5_45]|uniref:hypothetical protein n=1 Tax=Microbacterium sp. ZW T5_45 TaxID=3378080 RepID=UPI00385409B4
MDAETQPHCPNCGTVMREHARGFRCGGCGHVIDISDELATVVVPPEFDGPGIHGG